MYIQQLYPIKTKAKVVWSSCPRPRNFHTTAETTSPYTKEHKKHCNQVVCRKEKRAGILKNEGNTQPPISPCGLFTSQQKLRNCFSCRSFQKIIASRRDCAWSQNNVRHFVAKIRGWTPRYSKPNLTSERSRKNSQFAFRKTSNSVIVVERL